MSENEDMLSLLGSPWSLITRVSEIRWPHAYSFNTLLARWQKVVPLRSSNNQRNGYRAFRSNLWIQMGSRSYTKRDASYSSLRTPSSGATLPTYAYWLDSLESLCLGLSIDAVPEKWRRLGNFMWQIDLSFTLSWIADTHQQFVFLWPTSKQ